MNYHEVTYGNYDKSDYPSKLAYHLAKNYFDTEFDEAQLIVNDQLLDLGCGDGRYMQEFNNLNYKCKGIDKGKFDDGEYLIDDFDLDKDILPFDDYSFDIVFTKSTIEHLYMTCNFLQEANRVLAKGGKIIVLTPAWEYNWKWFYDDPTHIKPFHRKGLQDALRMADFRDVKVEYFYNLPIFWKLPKLKFLAKFVRLLPDDWRWKDWEQQKHNIFIRFCKEVQLLGVATK